MNQRKNKLKNTSSIMMGRMNKMQKKGRLCSGESSKEDAEENKLCNGDSSNTEVESFVTTVCLPLWTSI